MDPIAELEADHRPLAEQLDHLDALAAGRPAPASREALGQALRQEIDVHSRQEEVPVLPALAAHGLDAGRLRGLAADHAALRRALGACGRVRAAGGPQWQRPAGRITALPRAHLRIENERVFPGARQLLLGAEQDAVAAAFGTVHGGA